MLRLIPFQKEKKFCKIQVSICLLEFFIQFPFFYCSFLHYISADNLSFWQATEEEESVSLFSQLKAVHKAGPLTAILPLIYTWAICLRAACVQNSGIVNMLGMFPLPPCQFSRPTQPPTHLHAMHTQAHKEKEKKFSYLDGVDRCGWRAVQGGRERREKRRGWGGRKHKEKAWLVCEFNTCNLSYSELSCSLLFGSNRLMPRVRLNKSAVHSWGWNALSSAFSHSPPFRRFPFLTEKRPYSGLPFWFLQCYTSHIAILSSSSLLSSYLQLPYTHFTLSFSPLIFYRTSPLITPSSLRVFQSPIFCSLTTCTKPTETPPVGSQELMKTPIRSSETSRWAILQLLHLTKVTIHYKLHHFISSLSCLQPYSGTHSLLLILPLGEKTSGT